ncbi:unnamed protein product [Phaeothamnion confervicola]
MGPIRAMDVHACINVVLSSHTMARLVMWIETGLNAVGIPPPYPDAERIALWICSTLSTLLGYYIFFGKRHRRRRKRLQAELLAARERVEFVQDKLMELEASEDGRRNGGKEVRIWMDGAFDMMHYGHMNAFRQGRALGTVLVVGVNSDESITQCKGPPVMNDEERLTAVEGCKFVDEVVTDVPYIMSQEYLSHVIEKHRIDFVVHGDDPCIVDGKDVYATAKAAGKYLSIPRTEGVSTTEIVGRMLLRSKSHHATTPGGDATPRLASGAARPPQRSAASQQQQAALLRSKFLTTSRMLRLFSAGVKAPAADARVVYIDGAWDMFHAGHVKILRAARAMGDYLIVGVHGDQVVNERRGLNMPIMNLNERVLSVLGCGRVDDVLIDAPVDITREMVASLRICAVCKGTVDDNENPGGERGQSFCDYAPYRVPREMGIFHELESPSTLTVSEIVGRIQKNEALFQRKFARKKIAEDEYYNKRYNLGSENGGENGGGSSSAGGSGTAGGGGGSGGGGGRSTGGDTGGRGGDCGGVGGAAGKMGDHERVQVEARAS